jgi:hypothetical protein
MMDTVDEQGLILTTRVSRRRVPVGGEVEIAVMLHAQAVPAELFVLVAYANGQSQQVEAGTRSPEARVSWRVTERAAPGAASFRLFADRECPSCGGGWPPPRGQMRGTFTVVADPD